MEPFATFRAIAVPIDIANCDTDQIIPVRFVRMARDDPDYASFLLHDLRFAADGSSRGFILDRPPFDRARIVVAGENWGCGSSRENAVYAMVANGIRAVIAPSIADIHHTNCKKNGVVPVVLPAEVCDALRRRLHETPGAEVEVDLARQVVTGPDGVAHGFAIDPFDKHRLLNGLDDIGLTLEYEAEIAGFEARHRRDNAWAY